MHLFLAFIFACSRFSVQFAILICLKFTVISTFVIMVSLDVVEDINLDDDMLEDSMNVDFLVAKSSDETGNSNACVTNDTMENKVSFAF